MNASLTHALPRHPARAEKPPVTTPPRARAVASTLALTLPLMAALPARAIPLDPTGNLSTGSDPRNRLIAREFMARRPHEKAPKATISPRFSRLAQLASFAEPARWG